MNSSNFGNYKLVEFKSIREEISDPKYFWDIDHNDIEVDINLNYEVRKKENEKNAIIIFLHVRFSTNNPEDISFLHYDFEAVFNLEGWDKIIKNSKEGGYSIGLEFLIILLSLTISTARGYMIAKSSQLGILSILPIVDPELMAKSKKNKIKKSRYYFKEESWEMV